MITKESIIFDFKGILMTPILKLKLCLIVFICSYSLPAQVQITGQIFSVKDSQPIIGASVYFDGTSIGVATDIDGHFTITTKTNITSALIINALGYKTRIFQNPMENPNLGIIRLEESEESLGVVHLESDPWSRQRKLEIFRKEFLGPTPMAIQCKIQNEDALILRYIPSTKTLVASSLEPLKIINKYLGYEVTYNLTDFKAEFGTEEGTQFTRLVYYEGSSFFEELSNIPLRRYIRNREKAFKGSHLHFMRSLATKKLAENNFRIFKVFSEVLPYTYFQINRAGGLTEVKLLNDKLWVGYGRQRTAIHSNGIFYIDVNGNATPPKNIVLSGRMGTLRIAGLLPLNYNF